jgi:rod shape-determining protein MreD
MRWLAYFILAYVTLGLQTGMGAYVQFRGAAPNLVMLVMLFIVLCAPRDAALLGAFGLGLLQDLLTQQPLGLYAFAYGLIALLFSSGQSALSREHPATHVVLSLVGSVICSILILLHGWIRMPVRIGVGTLFYEAIYTALLAPFVLGGLMRIRRLFGFHAQRRRI